MITNRKRPVSILLAVILLFSLTADVFAQGSADTPDQVLSATAEYLIRQVPEPQYGSVGGAWLILGLCRAGAHIPDGYTQGYADRLGAILKENGGVLGNQRRYTDYSREVLAVTAMGLDARDLAGYDLTAPLGDFDAVVKQGLSGPVWALIALDSGGYPMPAGDEQATRWKYVQYILDAQLPDGGWAYSGRTPADPDMTAMCLTALAGYRGEKRVSAAVQAGVERLSLIQKPDGGFASYGIETAESCAQVVTALCALGMDPDSLVQDGNSVVDALLRYGNGDGSFRHLQDGQRDQMATEQAFYALAAWKRMGSGSLYQMERRVPVHPDVHIPAAALPGTTFPDLPEDGTAILALAERGIINGKGNGMFDPEAGMTRAEFAAITVRALGLEPGTTDAFSDVQADAWYAPWIGTATRYGIVNGVGGGKFSPETAITWQEAAVMVSRAARLAGMETEGDTRTTLKPAEAPGDWALSGVAFAYREGLLTEISPRQVISRADLAEMLYRMLCVCGAMT